MHSSDAEYFEQIKKGDKDALAFLYQKYSQYAYSIALGITKNYEDAQDVVQDVFLSVWEHRGSLDLSRGPKSYLLKAVRNASINRLRINHRDVELSDDASIGKENVESSVKSELMLSRIGDFLSEEEISIFYLHAAADYTFSEIADITGLSLFAVAGIYRRTLKKIKNNVEDKAK